MTAGYDWSTIIGVGPNASDVTTVTVDANTMSTSPYGWGTMSSAGIGSPVVTTGSSRINWNDTITASNNLFPDALDVKGDANFRGDIKIKGKSLSDMLEKIEERLAILHPNEALEEQWENLKGLGKAYRELEAEILEKEKIWSILKK